MIQGFVIQQREALAFYLGLSCEKFSWTGKLTREAESRVARTLFCYDGTLVGAICQRRDMLGGDGLRSECCAADDKISPTH
jgi:hypothetical protein